VEDPGASVAAPEGAAVSLLDSLTPAAREELRLFVQAEIQAAFRQHEERRRWMSPQETADYLGLTLGAVRGRIERETLPVRRLGERTILIDRYVLDEIIENGRP
jgi:hypothetical protein